MGLRSVRKVLEGEGYPSSLCDGELALHGARQGQLSAEGLGLSVAGAAGTGAVFATEGCSGAVLSVNTMHVA